MADFIDFFKTHPASKHLFMVDSIVFLPALTTLYLLFVLKWGPAFMKNRAPYELKTVILIYNLVQIFLNLYFIIYSLVNLLLPQPTPFGCLAPLAFDHPLKTIEANVSNLYFKIKVFDYMDTIFFVLRKSFRQITFLHLLHHVFMVLGTQMYLRGQGTGGQPLFMGIINSFVHVAMYGYYFYTALNSDKKVGIWWKKYLTQLQLVQHLSIFSHHLYPILFVPECPIPKFWLLYGATFAFLMIILFGKFYYKTYLQPTRRKQN